MPLPCQPPLIATPNGIRREVSLNMAHEDLQNTFLTRRSLIITAITGVVGFSFAGFCEEHAWAEGENGDVNDFMLAYADQLGYSKNDLIASYQDRLPSNVRDETIAMNRKMRRWHFTDWDNSNVYREEQTLFYTAGHADNFNACTAFYDLDQPIALRTAMEGPTLVGLAVAAHICRSQKNYSRDATRGLLYPVKATTSSAGTFQTGYAPNHKDKIITKNGHGEVGYENILFNPSTKTGKGKITVTFVEDNNGNPRIALNKAVHIKYQAV